MRLAAGLKRRSLLGDRGGCREGGLGAHQCQWDCQAPRMAIAALRFSSVRAFAMLKTSPREKFVQVVPPSLKSPPVLPCCAANRSMLTDAEANNSWRPFLKKAKVSAVAAELVLRGDAELYGVHSLTIGVHDAFHTSGTCVREEERAEDRRSLNNMMQYDIMEYFSPKEAGCSQGSRRIARVLRDPGKQGEVQDDNRQVCGRGGEPQLPRSRGCYGLVERPKDDVHRRPFGAVVKDLADGAVEHHAQFYEELAHVKRLGRQTMLERKSGSASG